MACNKKKKMANGGKVSEKKKPQLKCGGRLRKRSNNRRGISPPQYLAYEKFRICI